MNQQNKTESLNLELIGPNLSKKFNVQWIEIESPTGSFLVGIDHCPLVSIIKQNSKIIYKEFEGEESFIEIAGGFLSVYQNNAVILVDQSHY